MKLITTYVYPPIPTNRFDWAAYDDDTYCGCADCHCIVGYGPTKEAAIADFNEQYEEKYGSNAVPTGTAGEAGPAITQGNCAGVGNRNQ